MSATGTSTRGGRTKQATGAASRDDRREQLLDTAAELVRDHGLMGFTMEGLASAAGVSKALPYRHFANADAALVALYRRELVRLTAAIFAAVDGIGEGDAMMAAGVHAYFDHVVERGELMQALVGAGSPVLDLAADGRSAPGFIIELIRRGYGLRGRTAVVLASLVGGLVIAGSDSMARGDAARSTVERTTVAAAIGAVHAVTGT